MSNVTEAHRPGRPETATNQPNQGPKRPETSTFQLSPAFDGPKPYKFIGFGDIDGPKPYEFIGFGDIDIKLPVVCTSWSHPTGSRAGVSKTCFSLAALLGPGADKAGPPSPGHTGPTG